MIAVSGSGLQAALGLESVECGVRQCSCWFREFSDRASEQSGTSVLTISQVNAAGSGFSANGITLPLSLNPGATSTFNVQYLPAYGRNSARKRIDCQQCAFFAQRVGAERDWGGRSAHSLHSRR